MSRHEMDNINFTHNHMPNNDTVIGSPYSPPVYWLLAVLFGLLIIGTAFGNFLVMLAVGIVRKLQTPSNLLIVSLALSDFLVAVLVLPFSSLQQLNNRQWQLGHVTCDIFISFDVMLCTASILNLCAISIDRYLVITRPMTYSTKRTPLRMSAMILATWLLSACITIPPLLISKETSRKETECEYSEELFYQIYACLCAFYVPLLVMLLLYGRIYRLAQKMHQADSKQKILLDPTSNQTEKQHCPVSPRRSQSHFNLTTGPSVPGNGEEAMSRKVGLSARPSILLRLSYSDLRSSSKPAGSQQCATLANLPPCFAASLEKQRLSSCDLQMAHNPLCCASPAMCQLVFSQSTHRKTLSSASLSAQIDPRGISSGPGSRVVRRLLPHCNKAFTGLSLSPSLGSNLRTHFSQSQEGLYRAHVGEPPVVKEKRRRHGSTDAEKSSQHQTKTVRTLGCVMGCFILCWLPFFLMQPLILVLKSWMHFNLMEDAVGQQFFTIFLWLGYANSFLNPIIYAKFNQEFRRPFKEILFCRCRRINEHLRSQFHVDHYGLKERRVRTPKLLNMASTMGQSQPRAHLWPSIVPMQRDAFFISPHLHSAQIATDHMGNGNHHENLSNSVANSLPRSNHSF